MAGSRSKFGLVQVGIILLAIATAAIHFSLNFPDPMFILNGLGYLGLLGALYLPLPFFKDHRRFVRFVFIGYTLLTILLWLVMGARTPIGYTAKIIELALVGLLWVEAQAERPAVLRKTL